MNSGDRKTVTDGGQKQSRSILPGFISQSFLRKFVATLLVVLLVIGGMSMFVYAQTSTQIQEDVEAEYTGTAERNAGDIVDWQSERSSNVGILSESPALEDPEDEEINVILENERDRLPDDVRAVHYVNLDDQQIVASSTPARPGTQLNIVEAPWAYEDLELDDDDVFVSDVEEIQGAPTVSYVSPVDGPDGNFALVLTSNLDNVVDGFAEPTEDTFTQVVNQDGSVVAGDLDRTDDTLDSNVGTFLDYTDDIPNSVVIQDGFAGNTGFLDSTEVVGLDQDYVTAYAPVAAGDDVELVVAVHVPTEQAFALQSAITTSMLGLLAATFIGLGFMAVTFGRGTVRSINHLSTKAQALEQGNLDEEIEVTRADEIGNLGRAFSSMRDTIREVIEEAETARQEAEVAREEAERINEHLVTKAAEYETVMQEAAEGNLQRRMEPESESEAMTSIAEEFNEMLAEIEQTVTELKSFSTEVAVASEEVTASSEEVRGASEQVTESVQEISDGAERQNNALLKSNEEMTDLSATVSEIAETSSQVAMIAERTARTGREGRSAAQEAIDGMNEIEDESQETVEAMERLQAEMQQIDELLEFITEIATQTNMLALNANIEASRSVSEGESEGFGVVASEIKDLASETKDAAQDIEKRLEGIKAETDRAAEEVQTTQAQISSQTESVAEAADALEDVAEYAQETNKGVQQIDTATGQQKSTTEDVVQMLEETATISEETTVEAENVAAAAEEQTTALTEMSDSASDLSTRASRLSEALDRFDTDAEADAIAASDGLKELAADVEAEAGAGTGTEADVNTAVDETETSADGTNVAYDEDAATGEDTDNGEEVSANDWFDTAGTASMGVNPEEED